MDGKSSGEIAIKLIQIMKRLDNTVVIVGEWDDGNIISGKAGTFLWKGKDDKERKINIWEGIFYRCSRACNIWHLVTSGKGKNARVIFAQQSIFASNDSVNQALLQLEELLNDRDSRNEQLGSILAATDDRYGIISITFKKAQPVPLGAVYALLFFILLNFFRCGIGGGCRASVYWSREYKSGYLLYFDGLKIPGWLLNQLPGLINR